MHHLEETRRQIERLKQAFEIVQKEKEALKSLASLNVSEKSQGMDGIIHKGIELVRHCAHTDAIDLALTAAGRKIEHFEMGCYTNLIPLAKQLGYADVEKLLSASLAEEKEANTILTQFTEKEIEHYTRTKKPKFRKKFGV